MSDWMIERGLMLILGGAQLAWMGALAWGVARVVGVV